MAGLLSLQGVSKRFRDVLAVDHVDLDVQQGEMVTLLGPSGCGKSTTLRMIAGLERPDSGDIWFRDRLVSSAGKRVFVPAERRGFGMVFQSYAVWPHMTVFDNVAFPLALRRVPRREQRERVRATLALLGLDAVENRYATMLSGGQQQRVALARAIVYNPEVLLLDEPLSNLDAALREQMRVELRSLQQRLGLTSIFVTHDQAEAMVLSDRVIVMNRGRIEEVGPPREIYERPRSRFTMDFVGRVNYLTGRVLAVLPEESRVRVEGLGGAVLACPAAADVETGDEILLCVRPEDIELAAPSTGRTAGALPAIVRVAAYLGDRVEYTVRAGDVELRTSSPPSLGFKEGETVSLTIPREAVRIWPRGGATAEADPRQGVAASAEG